MQVGAGAAHIRQDAVDHIRMTVSHLHPCRDCVQQLLSCGGDSMAYNRDDNLPCDLGSSGSQVWTTLERDMQWRTCLQVRRNGHDGFAGLRRS